MTQTFQEYTYYFRDKTDPSKFYEVKASDYELATLRAFDRFGHNITSYQAKEMLELRKGQGDPCEIIEWRND